MTMIRRRPTRPLSHIAAVTLGAALALSAASASAQAPAPPTAPPASAPLPDVVRLKDGSMYRGEILELVANDHVDIRLATGETKRFSMTDVTFAGAAPNVETPPPPAPPPPKASPARAAQEPTAIPVDFETDLPDIDVYKKDGESVGVGYVMTGRGGGVVEVTSSHYARLCGAPCSTTFEPGRYRLALSMKGRSPVESREDVTVQGPSRVTGTYKDNRGLRIAGWLTYAGAWIVGGGLAAIGLLHQSQSCSPTTSFPLYGGLTDTIGGGCTSESAPNYPLLITGISVAVVGQIVGLVLAFQSDKVSFSVAPLEVGAVERGLAKPEGLALKMQF